jgi:hypothetical protein
MIIQGKNIWLITGFCMLCSLLRSQDLIVKKDGSSIFCKIESVDSLQIKYTLNKKKNSSGQNIARSYVSRYYYAKPFHPPYVEDETRGTKKPGPEKGSVVSQFKYSKKNTHCVTYNMGCDTLLRVQYYSDGKLMDSAWYHTLTNGKEMPFGTRRSYFCDGTISSFTTYKNDRLSLYVSYFSSGKVSRIEHAPGLVVDYDEEGKIIAFRDQNKHGQVKIPRRHNYYPLINSSISQRIRAHAGYLVSENKYVRFIHGNLITFRVKSDTIVRDHCVLEGIKGDTLFFSHFDYDLNKSKADLKYDSTFAVCFSQINDIYYSPHFNSCCYQCHLTCAVSSVVILEMGLILAKADPILVVPAAAAGLPLAALSSRFRRIMIPKVYNTGDWDLALHKPDRHRKRQL